LHWIAGKPARLLQDTVLPDARRERLELRLFEDASRLRRIELDVVQGDLP
jgi:hypothetical protein